MDHGAMRQQVGNYRLLKLIGRGGFAQVYLAEHIYLKTQAAVKVLYAHLVEEEFASFLREAQMIANLKHPHIIPLFDFGVDEVPYLVMEYLPQGSLRDRHGRGEVLSLSSIVSYVKQVADALQFAHEMNVVHRDVKPENLLISNANGLLLSDFGIAARVASLQTVTPAGSAYYMAPEQIAGKPRPASDQYALGCVVYEWICGLSPFHGDPLSILYQQTYAAVPSLRDRVPSLPVEVEKIVQRALSKDPEQRFSNIQAFARALEQAVAITDTAQAKTIPLLLQSPIERPLSRRRVLTGLCLMGLVAAGAEGFIWFSKRAPAPAPVVRGKSLLMPVAPRQLPGIPGQWEQGQDLLLSLDRFSATALKNGKILIEGGRIAAGQYAIESQLFDPTTGKWLETGHMSQPRSEHTATLLQDGTVLVVGGYDGEVVNVGKTVERYDPQAGRWSFAGEMQSPRAQHSTTLLANGQVLVAGGWGGNVINGKTESLASCDIYDPATGTWSPTKDMTRGRANHIAVLLADGKVLVAGGVNTGIALATAEIYDPDTNEWTPTGDMVVPRVSCTAVFLEKEQQVLVIGGLKNQNSDLVPTKTTEFYDPLTKRWTMTGSMAFKRPLTPPTIMLPNQTVLVIGADGLNGQNAFGTCEIYQPVTKTWVQAAKLVHPRIGHAAVLLQGSGQVLVAGGSADGYAKPMFKSTEIWTPG